MQVIAQFLNGKQTILDVEPSDSIAVVKDKIFDQEGIPSDQTRLVFAGKQLDDDLILEDIGVKELSIMFLLVRTRC